MSTVEVTIGWTKQHELPPERRWSEYQPGDPQHTLTFTLDVYSGMSPEETTRAIAEDCFVATNHPVPQTLNDGAGLVYSLIKQAGYRGQEGGHYSLSVGDTVTVSEIMLACVADGWERVSGVASQVVT